MKRRLQWRLLVILAVVAGNVYLFYPPSEKIKLGLDLRGGIHMVVEVDVDEALDAEVMQVRDRIESELRRQGVSFSRVGVLQGLRVEVEGVSGNQQAQVETLLREYSDGWTYQSSTTQGRTRYVLAMTPQLRRHLSDLTVRQTRETISSRVDQYGVAEPSISIYGSGDVKRQIIVELPGVDDPQRVQNLITTAARLELRLVHPGPQGGPFPTPEAVMEVFANGIPPEFEILPYRNPSETGDETMFMVVRRAAAITGHNLTNARRSQDTYTGRPEVVFFLDSQGVSRFSQVTGDNVGNRLAIVLDDEIRSAPNINERITTQSARITGQFTMEQAADLALTLRTGALPASVSILENRVIGPSLGSDSIRRGIQAVIVGFGLVLVGMVVLFKLSGVNAIVCLMLNLLILMGLLAYFGATLTLPGIAGIILTIGMAVDANILIFERIKEELRLGKSVRSAIDAGFSKVFSTIIDTNITTLVAALFLFQFGTGPVRGFAVTLAIGLLANIFTATFVSRTFFDLLFRRREVERLSI